MTYCIFNTNSQRLCNNGLMTEIKICLWMNISFIKGTTAKQPNETCTWFFIRFYTAFILLGCVCFPLVHSPPPLPSVTSDLLFLILSPPEENCFWTEFSFLFLFFFLVGFPNFLTSTLCLLLMLGKAGLKMHPLSWLWRQVTSVPWWDAGRHCHLGHVKKPTFPYLSRTL